MPSPTRPMEDRDKLKKRERRRFKKKRPEDFEDWDW